VAIAHAAPHAGSVCEWLAQAGNAKSTACRLVASSLRDLQFISIYVGLWSEVRNVVRQYCVAVGPR